MADLRCQRVEAETLRSMTCVGPIDLRYSACLREAVVMMGEKPESYASWIAGWLMLQASLLSKSSDLATYHFDQWSWIHP